MNKISKMILGFLILSFCVFSTSCFSATQSIPWLHSYEEALRQAQDEKMPIMIDFYTDWCGWCTKLDRETYQNKEVIELSKKFVCLKIDGDKNRPLIRKYNVTGFPTVLFTDTEGKKIGGGAGFRNADNMLSEMNYALSKFNK